MDATDTQHSPETMGGDSGHGRAGVRGIGWSLTGEDLALDAAVSGVEGIVAWLARHGWDAVRLQERAGRIRQEGGRWPAPVDADRRGGMGPAQFQALLRQVLLALGLDHAAPVLRDATTPMDAVDRRLVAELPPHHGRVG